MAGQDTMLLELSLAGVLTVGVKTLPSDVFLVPCNLEILGGWVNVGTAPTGAALIVNVQRTKLADATTSQLWTTAANRPTVAIAATTSMVTTGISPNIVATKPPQPDNFDVVMGDLLAVNVIQVGSSVAGSDLSLILMCEKN